MATVYRRGSTWWVRFQWRGVEVRRSARTSSKAVAQQMLGRLLAEHRRLDRGGRPRRTYREALERFWAEYMPTLKPASQRPRQGCGNTGHETHEIASSLHGLALLVFAFERFGWLGVAAVAGGLVMWTLLHNQRGRLN